MPTAACGVEPPSVRARAMARRTRSEATEADRESVSGMITPNSVVPTRQATSSARTLPPMAAPSVRIEASTSSAETSSTLARASATGRS